MHLLKLRVKDGWIMLYKALFNNCLKRTSNLNDLTDKAEARKNIELIDNVTTHHHDSRYLPLIEAFKDQIKKEVDDFKKEISQSFKDKFSPSNITNLNSLAYMENGWYLWTGTLDAVNGTWLILKMSTCYTATCLSDTRCVFYSTDLSNWNSSYGYWKA